MKRHKSLMFLSLLSIALTASCTEKNENTMVGTLERDRIELKVESSEPIVAIRVEDGDIVNAGTLILEQNPSRHQARWDQQAALRDQAAARLGELRRGPRKEAIAEAQARLVANEVLTRNAMADLERATDIFERGLSNQADLDSARTQWQASDAREQADREALAALLSGTTVEELQQAQAALDAAEAGLAQAQLDLERLQVIAPIAGIIDKVLFEQGERPPPGTTVAVLLDGSRSYARVYVPEQLKTQVVRGTRLEIRFDGIEGLWQGTVRWVSSDASFTPYFALTEHDRTRLSFLAEVDIENASSLPTGLPLEAWIPVATAQ